MREVLRLDLPAGLGNDVAGVVDAIGDGVTILAIGDEVLGTSATPAYAEQLSLTPPHWCASLPDSRGK